MLPAITRLQPSGMLDQTNANQFRQQINELVRQGVKIILIDFKEVSFMDSSGLGALVLSLKTVTAAGGRLFLISLNDQVKMLFELTNMKEVFDIVANQEELEQKLAQ
jgi:anti-anti-sigma factor